MFCVSSHYKKYPVLLSSFCQLLSEYLVIASKEWSRILEVEEAILGSAADKLKESLPIETIKKPMLGPAAGNLDQNLSVMRQYKSQC